MVCESSVDYNKGIGYTFYVGHNGKNIDTIEKNDTVSLKFIKKNLGEENAKQILEEYKKKTEERKVRERDEREISEDFCGCVIYRPWSVFTDHRDYGSDK